MMQAYYGKAKGMKMPNTATGRKQRLKKGKSYAKVKRMGRATHRSGHSY